MYPRWSIYGNDYTLFIAQLTPTFAYTKKEIIIAHNQETGRIKVGAKIKRAF